MESDRRQEVDSDAVSSSESRNVIPIQNKFDRVIILVDMDCFYCQVEEKLDPSLKGQPLAVVQYNAWRGGGIIAVNYAARAKGVTRHMRGDEAREHCPEIILAKVPNVREKADLSKYRDAGGDVAKVLQRFTVLLERASVDEAYLDITSAVNDRLDGINSGTFELQPQELVNTYAVGYPRIGDYVIQITSQFTDPEGNIRINYQNAHDTPTSRAVRLSNIRLLIGASIASEIRAAVKQETGYECSAGIAHNKILAKLACGLNKPNKQTVLPISFIPALFDSLPVGKITGLGGKFGDEVCKRLGVRFLGQLLHFTEAELQDKFDSKNGTWLYNICRGIDLEPVVARFYSKSIGCCKKFPGRNSIAGMKTLNHWLTELATEISERLKKDIVENNRKARQMVLSYIQDIGGEEVSSSRSAPLQSYNIDAIVKQCLDIIKLNTKPFFRPGSSAVLNNLIKFLSLSVGKFQTIPNAQSTLLVMFANQASKKGNGNGDETSRNPAASGEDADAADAADVEATSDDESKSKFKGKIQNFFAKQVQTKMTGNSAASAATTTITTTTATNSTITRAIQSQNDIELIAVPKLGTPSEHDEPAKVKSFFLNALKNKKIPATSEKCISHMTGGGDVVGADDIRKLEEELQIIEDERPGPSSRSRIARGIFAAGTLVGGAAEQTSISAKGTQPVEASISTKAASNVPHRKRKYSEVIATDPESLAEASVAMTSKDYMNNYAEYATPEMQLVMMIKCETCGRKIPNDERSQQTHRDHHYAQELSQQQRAEFRRETKFRIDLRKKPRKAPRATTISVKADITKFFKPMNSPRGQRTGPTATITAPPSESIIPPYVALEQTNESPASSELTRESSKESQQSPRDSSSNPLQSPLRRQLPESQHQSSALPIHWPESPIQTSQLPRDSPDSPYYSWQPPKLLQESSVPSLQSPQLPTDLPTTAIQSPQSPIESQSSPNESQTHRRYFLRSAQYVTHSSDSLQKYPQRSSRSPVDIPLTRLESPAQTPQSLKESPSSPDEIGSSPERIQRSPRFSERSSIYHYRQHRLPLNFRAGPKLSQELFTEASQGSSRYSGQLPRSRSLYCPQSTVCSGESTKSPDPEPVYDIPVSTSPESSPELETPIPPPVLPAPPPSSNLSFRPSTSAGFLSTSAQKKNEEFKVCPICFRTITKREFVLHKDLHMAQICINQLRERNLLPVGYVIPPALKLQSTSGRTAAASSVAAVETLPESPASPEPVPVPSTPASPEPVPSTSASPGTSFGSPRSTDAPSTSGSLCAPSTSSRARMFKTCPICHESVPLREAVEHNDFHMAQNLQNALNGIRTSTTQPRNPSDTQSGVGQRRRGNSGSAQSKTKPITKYFSKPKDDQSH